MLISSRHLLRREKGTLFSLYLLLAAKANFPKRLLPTSDFFSLLKSSSKSSSSSSDPLVTWIEVKYVVLDTRTSVLKKLIGLSVRGLRLLLVFWWCFRGCYSKGGRLQKGEDELCQKQDVNKFLACLIQLDGRLKNFSGRCRRHLLKIEMCPNVTLYVQCKLLFSTLQKGKRLNRIDKMTNFYAFN